MFGSLRIKQLWHILYDGFLVDFALGWRLIFTTIARRSFRLRLAGK